MRTENYQKKSIGGLKISFVNTGMIVITTILAILLFIISGHVRASFNSAINGANEYIYLEQQANIVYEASDYLTTEVRLFVETADLTHAELYFEEANVTKRREAALNALAQQTPLLIKDINEAVVKSQNLMKREIYAMKLVCSAQGYDQADIPPEVRAVSLDAADEMLPPAEKLKKAQSMVFDSTYQQAKSEIYNALKLFVDDTVHKTKQEFDFRTLELSNLLSLQRVLICVLIVMVVLISLAIAFLISKPLRFYLSCIQNQQLLKPVGAYEFRYMAQIYNETVVEKQSFRHKAEHDLMTGVLNRASAEARVRELMENPESHGILILLDIDDLKGINDNLGHKAGDKAILSLAKALKSQFRDDVVIGRLGGDEFLLYLPDAAEKQDAISISLTSMQKKLSAVLLDEGSKRRVCCSIGCAVQAPDAVTYEDLFRQADLALYRVKRSVKNSYAFFANRDIDE